jgi:hypothetical protein
MQRLRAKHGKMALRVVKKPKREIAACRNELEHEHDLVSLEFNGVKNRLVGWMKRKTGSRLKVG